MEQSLIKETKNSNKALWITGIVIIIVILGIVTNFFGLLNKSPFLEIGSSPVLGNPNAPVTIYEFSDFSCSACASFDKNTFPKIKTDYIDSGKVRMVFKYFPGHGQGLPSQIVGFCLNEQSSDLFWNFVELAFANQKDLLSYDKMKSLAISIGANSTELNSCIDSGIGQAQIDEDYAMAKKAGISGTPTFFINGKKISGAQSYQTFKDTIDSKL
jgi:protein-disulfide isomerase